MAKYIFNVTNGQLNAAGSKAKADITKILAGHGFQQIDYDIPRSKIKRLFTAKYYWQNKLTKIDNGIFVFQYPMYSRFTTKILIKELKKHENVTKIIIIHDLESLRWFKDDKKTIKFELNLLNNFDCLIVHNDKMAKWLVSKGVVKKIVTLDIFDYLNPQKMRFNSCNAGISFAGNLEKSVFLTKLNINTRIQLMGPNPLNGYPNNIKYEGQYSPEELPQQLNGAFGLVWDGDSIETCSGLYGEYLQYNNPHKLSLYISSGIPVIVWSKSAMADFVKKNNIGLLVDTLVNLDDLLNSINENMYSHLQFNAEKIGKRLREGKYTLSAISHAIKYVK